MKISKTIQDLSGLLGAPLRAVVEAEAMAARATADFIKEVGFTGLGDTADPDFGKVRTVFFEYERALVDGTRQTVKMEVPLLSLVPIPSLQVQEASIRFDLTVLGFDEDDEMPEPKEGRGSFLMKKQAPLKAVYTRKAGPAPDPRKRDAGDAYGMQVHIRLGQADQTHGMIKLMHLLEDGLKETEK